jgi:hypothetical protein
VDHQDEQDDKFINEADIELKYASTVLGEPISERLAKETTVSGCLQTLWHAVGSSDQETTR